MAPRSYNILLERTSWRPGSFKQVPLPCLTALLLSTCCAIGAVATLVSSDNVDIDTWPSKRYPIQPTVFLAILSAIANTALRFAFSEGVTLAWWTQALKGGTLKDLHRRWAYGISLKDSVSSGKYFDKIALASLITSIVVIDGPLLQRATKVEPRFASRDTTVSASLSSDPLPSGFSGLYLSRSRDIHIFQPDFAQVVREHRAQDDIRLNYTGCQGSCDITLVAAGLDVNCSYGTHPFDIVTNTRGDSFFVGSLDTGWNSYTGNAGRITTNVTYKDDAACAGDLKTVQCILSAATVEYPIRITNGSAQLLANSNKTTRLQDPNTLIEGTTPGDASSYGGLALAISQQFPQSTISLYYSMQWDIQGSGTMATTYLSPREKVGSCNVTWNDPTPDILSFARDLMFRSAIKASSGSAAQTFRTTESYERTVYVSHYAFLAGALTVMVANVFVVAPLLWGSWLLGRKVTLSPVEIAKAFRALLMAEAGDSASVDALLDKVGRKTVRYSVAPVVFGEDEDAWSSEEGRRGVEREEESEEIELTDRSVPVAGVLCFEEVS